MTLARVNGGRRKLIGQLLFGALSTQQMRSWALPDRKPEVSSIRIVQSRALCAAPQYVAAELLRRSESLDVKFVRDTTKSVTENVALGIGDLGIAFAAHITRRVDKGDRVKALAGLHTGCYELFVRNGINSIRDLRGRTIGVWIPDGDHYLFVASMLAYVGVDPRTEVKWLAQAPEESIKALKDGRIDAYLAFPPENEVLRDLGIGRVIVNTTTDRPWSHYFCCMVVGSSEFIQSSPIACSLALRSFLMAADYCQSNPREATESILKYDPVANARYVKNTVSGIDYRTWRSNSPEDTLRFYALRLREGGLINSSPESIVRNGSDFKFLRQIRQDLKE